jgi:hypothetical protein
MVMAIPIIIRHHYGVQSYLVLDDNPRELLRHVGFLEEYSVRPWFGSVDPDDAQAEWAEMLAEDPDNYQIVDETNQVYCLERSFWDHCKMWPERKL